MAIQTKKLQSEGIPENASWDVYKNTDGTLTIFKARLVIQGFRERPRLDYPKTYAPVMTKDILRIILALSLRDSNVIAEQIDVVIAFLNANLTEDIFMIAPERSKGTSKYVKLQKSMYGLKQAPHEWFKTIDGD